MPRDREAQRSSHTQKGCVVRARRSDWKYARLSESLDNQQKANKQQKMRILSMTGGHAHVLAASKERMKSMYPARLTKEWYKSRLINIVDC